MDFTDEQIVRAVADGLNATVALERAQTAAGDARKRPKYERAVRKMLAVALRREPTDDELTEVLE